MPARYSGDDVAAVKMKHTTPPDSRTGYCMQEPRTVLEIAADEETFLSPPARQGASGNPYSPYQHGSNPFDSGSTPDTDYATPGDDAVASAASELLIAEEKADRAEERPGMHGI